MSYVPGSAYVCACGGQRHWVVFSETIYLECVCVCMCVCCACVYVYVWEDWPGLSLSLYLGMIV